MGQQHFTKFLTTIGLVGIFITVFSGCDKNAGNYSLVGTSQSFVQPSSTFQQSQIDVLWVIDNSSSMQTSQANLATNFSSFINKFQAMGLDYHMAITTSDAFLNQSYIKADTANQFYSASCQYNANAAVFKQGSTGQYGQGLSGVSVLTSSNTTPALFSQNASVGTGGCGDERAFSSILATLQDATNVASGFRRPGAYLAIIIVSDEDDFSGTATFADHFYTAYATNFVGDHNYTASAPTLESVSTYVTALDSYVGNHSRYSVNSIYADTAACVATLNASTPNASRLVATRYPALSQATGGISASLCGDFSQVLSGISQNVIELSSVFSLAKPANPTTIAVTVNGAKVAQGLSNGWTYTVTQPGGSPQVVTSISTNSITAYPAGTTYAIAFHGTAIPAAGASVSVSYTPATISQ